MPAFKKVQEALRRKAQNCRLGSGAAGMQNELESVRARQHSTGRECAKRRSAIASSTTFGVRLDGAEKEKALLADKLQGRTTAPGTGQRSFQTRKQGKDVRLASVQRQGSSSHRAGGARDRFLAYNQAL